MKNIKLLLLVLGLFCMTNVKAQGDVNLRLDSNFIGLPASVHVNEIDSLTIMIRNDSMVAFQGQITIGYVINGISGVADSATKPLFYPYDTETIAPQSMIVRTLVNHVINPYMIGPSGVVIWPIVKSTTNLHVLITDSLGFGVTVLPAVGIDEITERKLSVYMQGQQLMIRDNGIYELKQVELYDVEGNLLQVQQLSLSGAIDMGNYAAGVYLAEFTFADNAHAVVKVMNIR